MGVWVKGYVWCMGMGVWVAAWRMGMGAVYGCMGMGVWVVWVLAGGMGVWVFGHGVYAGGGYG